MNGHGGVLWIATGGKGVGLVALDQVDPWHGQAGIPGKPFHQGDKIRGAPGIHLLGIGCSKGHAVRIPPGEGIGDKREGQREQHARAAAQHGTDEHEQGGHGRKQHGCAHHVLGHQDLRHGTANRLWSGAVRAYMWGASPSCDKMERTCDDEPKRHSGRASP